MKRGDVEALGGAVDVELAAAEAGGGDAVGEHPVGIQAAVGDGAKRLKSFGAEGGFGGQEAGLVIAQAI
jgi:hypothetical protein